jgi:SEC-C motif-containing protein
MSFSDENQSRCLLCGHEATLQNSHIFPKFAVDWLKETGTGYLRTATVVNRRAQDGSKERMLCAVCEQRFSVAENYFAARIFRPVLEGATRLVYDYRMMYFLVSLLWRVAQVNLPKTRAKQNRFLDTIENAVREWGQFLLGGNLGQFAHVHLFVFDIAENPPPSIKGFNVYCARALDGTFFNNEQDLYVYAKFSRFLCIAILTPYDEAKWINTKVATTSSVLQIPQEIRDTFVGGFIADRADTVADLISSQMSSRQSEVIRQHFFKNADRMANSDLARAAFADYESQQEFIAALPKIGRNEKCPCGSQKKFKNCHGKPSAISKHL